MTLLLVFYIQQLINQTYQEYHIYFEMDEGRAQELIQKAMSLIKEEDIAHRGFLKPIEITLKTHKTEEGLSPNALPAGLKIINKKSIEYNKYETVNVQEIDQGMEFGVLLEGSQNNMLSLMKKKGGIQLAICICMYSEDKRMLKRTLAGVEENIANLVALEGLDPDQIGVFLMMDGIEKVDESVESYFQELERISNIFLGANVTPPLENKEMVKRLQASDQKDMNDQDFQNVNNFLFDPAELVEREKLRFEEVNKNYREKRVLKNKINQLNKKRTLYEDLPVNLQSFFVAEARKQRRVDYRETEEEVELITTESILKEYANDIKKARVLVGRALQEAEKYCDEFISSREDLAYLGCFRKKVPFKVSTLLQEHLKGTNSQYENLSDELQEEQKYTTMNLFTCVKYKNSGKLSSHNWFFNGFCKELEPKYAVLLDVGLKPKEDALLKMYNYMKRRDNRVGGVCGYMSLKIEKVEAEEEVRDEEVDYLTGVANKLFDIQRTQQVEYHFAHLMDKPFEAAFGFIHVLPGAFSAYNMKTLIDYQNKNQDSELLISYFKSIDEKLKNRKILNTKISVRNAVLRTSLPDAINSCCIDIDPQSDEAMLYDENVYLAEDRILCIGIHTKDKDLAYLPDAYAEVDPIKTVHGLLGQRKRWINGSYFAFEKVKRELSLHEKRSGFELMLNLQILYLSMMNSLAYFSPSFFLFTVHLAMETFRNDILVKFLNGVVPEDGEVYNAFVYTIDFLYVMLIITIIFLSLHMKNNNPKFKTYLYAVSTIMGLFMFAVMITLTVDIIRGLATNDDAFLSTNDAFKEKITGGINLINFMRYMLLGSVAIYFVPIGFYVLLFGNGHIFWEVVLGYFSFLFYTPTYLQILNIYSLCRIDDISWGTKGLEGGATSDKSLTDSWKLIKMVHVAKYVIWNIILATVLLTLGSGYEFRFFITLALVAMIAVTISVKVVIGVFYMLAYKCGNSCMEQKKPKLNEESRIGSIISHYEPQIRKDILKTLNGIKVDIMREENQGSLIQAMRSARHVKRAYQNQNDLFERKSAVISARKSNRPLKKQAPKPLANLDNLFSARKPNESNTRLNIDE